MSEDGISLHVEMGERNQNAFRLLSNWCAHARVVKESDSALAQLTGLPIGFCRVTCKHERAQGPSSMDLEENALEFYDRNCVGCSERNGVGSPNLLELVEVRKRMRDAAETARSEREGAEQARLKDRTTVRASQRTTLRAIPASVLDLLDAFDKDPCAAKAQELFEATKAVPEGFDSQVKARLIDVAKEGGNDRTEGSLRALEALDVEPPVRRELVSAALRALARGEAVERAGGIVATQLLPTYRELEPLVEPAARWLMWLTQPEDHSRGSLRNRPSNPRALVAAFRIAADKLTIAIRRAIRSRDAEGRLDGAYSVRALLGAGETEGARGFLDDLVASFAIGDGPLIYHNVSDVVAWTVGQLLAAEPEELAARLQAAYEKGGAAEREGVVRSFVLVFESRRRGARVGTSTRGGEATPLERIAYRQLMTIWSKLPLERRVLRLLSDFFDGERGVPWELETPKSSVQLGVAALAAGRLDDFAAGKESAQVKRPVADPDPLAPLESLVHELALEDVVNAALAVCVRVATKHPERQFRERSSAELLDTLERLSKGSGRLRVMLVGFLGKLAAEPAAAGRVLSALRQAMASRAWQVRASAARAYGELVRGPAGAVLPIDLHKVFLSLVLSVKGGVQDTAIVALDVDRLPPELHELAREVVIVLALAHASSERPDTLEHAVSNWVRLLALSNGLVPAMKRRALKLLRNLEPIRIMQFLWDHPNLGGVPEFGDLIVEVIARPKKFPLLDSRTGFVFSLLDMLPRDEVVRLSHQVAEVAVTLDTDQPWLPREILQTLADAEAWKAGIRLSRRVVEACGSTRDNLPLRLIAQAFEAALTLEEAASAHRVDDVVAATARLRAVEREIRKDDEDNREARESGWSPAGSGRAGDTPAEAYLAVYASRLTAVEALDLVRRGQGDASALEHAAAELTGPPGALEADNQVGRSYAAYAKLLSPLADLVRFAHAVRQAEHDPGRFLRAAQEGARTLSSAGAFQVATAARAAGESSSPSARERAAGISRSLSVDLTRVAALMEEAKEVSDIALVARRLLMVALPVPLVNRMRYSSMVRIGQSPSGRPADAAPEPMAFLTFELNGTEVAMPTTVQPDVLYDVHVKARLSRWPKAAKRLQLTPVSLEPSDTLQAPSFSIPRPPRLEEDDSAVSVVGVGRLRVSYAQDWIARPLEVGYMASFAGEPGLNTNGTDGVPVTVHGQRQLLIQSYAPNGPRITGDKHVDTALLQFKERLAPNGMSDDARAVLLRLVKEVAALPRVGKPFPERMSRDDLCEEVQRRLSAQTDIGAALTHVGIQPGVPAHLQMQGTGLHFLTVTDESKFEKSLKTLLNGLEGDAGDQRDGSVVLVVHVGRTEGDDGDRQREPFDLRTITADGGWRLPVAVVRIDGSGVMQEGDAGSSGHSDARFVFKLDRNSGTRKLSYEGKTCDVRDRKGLQYLACLLAKPNHGFSCQELAAGAIGGSSAPLAMDTEEDLGDDEHDSQGHEDATPGHRRPRRFSAAGSSAHSPSEPQMDEKGRRMVRTRLANLREEKIAEESDPARKGELEGEATELENHLKKATGLSGRPRPVPDDHERCRKAVSIAITRAIDLIERVHPELGKHLRANVTTGGSCRYSLPGEPPNWLT